MQLKPAEAGPGGASASPASTRLHAHGPGPGPVPAPRVTPRAGALCVVLTLFLFTYASLVCQRRGDCFSAWLMRAPPVPVQPRACHFMLCDLSVLLLAVAQKHEIALTLTSRTRAARGRQRRELRAPGSAARGLRESAAEPGARGRPAQKQALEGDGAGILGSARRGGAGHGAAGRPGQAGFRGRPFQGLTARLAGHVLSATCQFPWLRRKVMRGKSRSRAGGLAASPGAEGHVPRRRPPSQRQGRGRGVTRTTGTADTHVHAAQRRSLRLHSAGRLSHLQRGPLRDPWKLPAPPRPPAPPPSPAHSTSAPRPGGPRRHGRTQV